MTQSCCLIQASNSGIFLCFRAHVPAEWRSSHASVILWLLASAGSQSKIYFATGGLQPVSSSWRQAPWDPLFLLPQNTCGYRPYVISSLTRGWVCRLQLLLTLASAVILKWESRGTHDHILQSQIRDSPNLEGWPNYTPRHWVPFSSPPTTGRGSRVPLCPRRWRHRKHRFQHYLHCCVRTFLSDGSAAFPCLHSCCLAVDFLILAVRPHFRISWYDKDSSEFLRYRILWVLVLFWKNKKRFSTIVLFCMILFYRNRLYIR
jgi:hypothetical protein